jgi:GntR family transcriptional regulator/MocR family aminotransferase
MLSVLKKPTGGLIWLQFNTVISLIQLSEQALHDLFLPKTILYQDKDTCAIRLGFGH